MILIPPGAYCVECGKGRPTFQEQGLDRLFRGALWISRNIDPHAHRSVCFFTQLTIAHVFPAKIGYIRDDKSCIIGLRTIATIPLLTYDCFLNLFLTTLFVWPLLRRQLSNHKLRLLAKRTCW